LSDVRINVGESCWGVIMWTMGCGWLNGLGDCCGCLGIVLIE